MNDSRDIVLPISVKEKTGVLDKSIPRYGVKMLIDKTDKINEFPVPRGYRFCMYKKGDERDWAEIETAVGEFDSVSSAMSRFNEEFGEKIHEMEERCLFVETTDGEKIATATAWYGEHLEKRLGRLHWVAVKPEHQGQGIGKALISRILRLFIKLGHRDIVFLTSQTWSYKAIGLYKLFGFRPYCAGKQDFISSQSNAFETDDQIAWDLINKKIEEYQHKFQNSKP